MNFLILMPFVLALLGAALALGIEPRILLERTGDQVFRVTGSNQYAGYRFFSRALEGVEGFRHADGSRNRRGDSVEERRRQARRKRLAFTGANGWELSWGRIDDSRIIDDFMRGAEPTLSLVDPPPLWRMGLSWFCLGLAGLVFYGVIQNCFFPKR